jgi:hypothetical protein
MSINARNLYKTYRNTPVISDLSLDVLPGVVTGFLGLKTQTDQPRSVSYGPWPEPGEVCWLD